MPDSSDDSDEDIPLAQRRRELRRTTKPAKAPAEPPKRKADASPTSPKKQKAPSHDDDDVVCTGRSGHIALCDYAHPREYCAAVPFTAGQERKHCPNCYCYVCDAPAGDCTEWREHCKASRESAEWRLRREQRKAQQIDRQSAPPAAAQRNDAPPAGPPRSGQRDADRASAATTRGSAPERGRPEESVDLTSDGDDDAAEPSHPPSRPRTTSQGPATPDPASSSTPRTTRSLDAVDLDEEPDEEVVTMDLDAHHGARASTGQQAVEVGSVRARRGTANVILLVECDVSKVPGSRNISCIATTAPGNKKAAARRRRQRRRP